MVTLTGNWLNPRSFTVSALDVAYHLGRLPRFGGTVKGWWTGLQHSLLVARLANALKKGDRVELLALHHDTHEIITGDWTRPWKPSEVKGMQTMLDVVIGASIGLPTFTDDEHAEVKILDDLACEVEAHVMAPMVVARHPNSFGMKEAADAWLRDGLFEGLWTGDLVADLHSTWDSDGRLVLEFVAAHEALMQRCGMPLRAPRTVAMGGGDVPADDREAVRE